MSAFFVQNCHMNKTKTFQKPKLSSVIKLFGTGLIFCVFHIRALTGGTGTAEHEEGMAVSRDRRGRQENEQLGTTHATERLQTTHQGSGAHSDHLTCSQELEFGDLRQDASAAAQIVQKHQAQASTT